MQPIIIIPALNPNQKMLQLIDELIENGLEHIVVVDDGSSEKYEKVFKDAYEYGCHVVRHEENLGKGNAVKTGLKEAVKIFGRDNIFVTVDADGQHLAGDVKKVARTGLCHPGKLVLGTRDFHGDDVPWKSRLGNRITSAYFKFETGIKCRDTQTGLRAIPPLLLELALTTEGDRYEYELNFLLAAVRETELVYTDIETVYEEENRESHFHPVKDSYRIYKKPIRYVAIALGCSLADYLLFCLMLGIFHFSGFREIFYATSIARISSGSINFYLNRKYCFESHNRVGGDMVRYFELFAAQMCLSAFMVAVLSKFGIIDQIGKLIVDTILFFASYQLQKTWVFKNEERKGGEMIWEKRR